MIFNSALETEALQKQSNRIKSLWKKEILGWCFK